MTIDSVRRRIMEGESATVEFVRDLRSTAIGRTVCAFLNGDGGVLYIGVGDQGEIIGLKGDTAAHARKLELALKEAISPTTLFAAEPVTIDDRNLILIDVPQGSDRLYVVDGGVWLRNADRTVAADVETLSAMVREQAEAPIRWERRVSPQMTVEDVDPDEVRATVREAEESGRFVFSDRQDDVAVLKDLSTYETGAFTQGGDVIFSRAPARRHPQCRAQFVRVGPDKTNDLFKTIRSFEGPLVRVYKDLLGAIDSATSVQAAFIAGTSERVELPAYEYNAVREGLVNAFVHRDYSAYSGGLRVTMYENRLEIWNSGRLPEGLTPVDLRHEHPSILVNPDIANVFYVRRQIERVGRGTERIVAACKKIGARPPLWRDNPTGVTLTMFAATLTAAGRPVELNERQDRLLLDLQPEDAITPKDYHDRYAPQVSSRQARRDLEELEGLGWLRREGQTRTTRYRLP